MSPYRRAIREIWSENDVRVLNREHSLGGGKPAATVAASPPSMPPLSRVDWTLMRKADPANVILPATRRWMDALPPEIRPDALVAAYARIANRIAACWDNEAECRMVFDDLLVDRRGGRRGFPPDVRRDLLALRQHLDGGHGARH